MPSPTVPPATASPASLEALNQAVIAGRLVRPPEHRDVPGGTVTELEVAVATPAGTDRLPLTWPDPPPSVASLRAGDHVVAVGRVRRRFFRVGGATQARTDVVVTTLVPLRRRRKAVDAVSAAADFLLATVEDA